MWSSGPAGSPTTHSPSASRSVREHYRVQALKHQARTRDALRRAGVDHAVIGTREGYVRPLMNLFRQRD